MTPRPVATLAGREARAYVAARQAVDRGRHERTFAVADLVRVVNRYFAGDAFRRAIAAAHKRADEAEAEVEILRARLEHLGHPQPAPHRIAEVTRLQKVILDHAARGRRLKDIADDFCMKPSAVQAHLARVADICDADNTGHALALINKGVVALRVRETKRKGRAA